MDLQETKFRWMQEGISPVGYDGAQIRANSLPESIAESIQNSKKTAPSETQKQLKVDFNTGGEGGLQYSSTKVKDSKRWDFRVVRRDPSQRPQRMYKKLLAITRLLELSTL